MFVIEVRVSIGNNAKVQRLNMCTWLLTMLYNSRLGVVEMFTRPATLPFRLSTIERSSWIIPCVALAVI